MSAGYRLSRCTDISNAPQTWHWAVVDGDHALVWRELVDAVRPHVHPAALIDAHAEIRAVLERVEACRAIDPDDVKNITRFRDLWEIRFQLHSFGLTIRIYETEVADLPVHLVALLAHRKVVDVDNDEIADLQNEEISEAIHRWMVGRPNYWGVV